MTVRRGEDSSEVGGVDVVDVVVAEVEVSSDTAEEGRSARCSDPSGAKPLALPYQGVVDSLLS